MRIVHSLEEVEANLPHPVLTIGSYDGIHCGHRGILEQVVARARARGGTAMVLTFHPHPPKIVSSADAPRLLQTFEQKAALLRGLGIDLLARIPFTQDLARLLPRQFMVEVLRGRFGVRELHVGASFRFGHRRAGDVGLLRRLGAELGVAISEAPEYCVRGQAVSSTRIRRLLAGGQVEFARRMLGRPFSLTGTVVHGAGLGARIGIPTANLDVHNELIPGTGVYVTTARLGDRQLEGVTNVGFRPTVRKSASEKPVVETHLLDLDEDLYGREMELSFLFRVRVERKFSGAPELVQRIRRDIRAARRYFARSRSLSGAPPGGQARRG